MRMNRPGLWSLGKWVGFALPLNYFGFLESVHGLASAAMERAFGAALPKGATVAGADPSLLAIADGPEADALPFVVEPDDAELVEPTKEQTQFERRSTCVKTHLSG